MARQLVLIDTSEHGERRGRADWKLDERTKEVGRRGVAQARKVLQQKAPKTAA